jgi:four helix bundle protein
MDPLPVLQGAGMKTPAKTFQDLEVCKNSHAFVLGVYRLTSDFPPDERFGMVSQFRRAAVSIPANIAHGSRKYTAVDKARFFNSAEGSLEECRYYCILPRDLGYGNSIQLQKALDGLSGQPAGYIHRLRES